MEIPESLSVTERLILANQYRILHLLEGEDTDSNRINEEIVVRGSEGDYYHLFQHLHDAVPISLYRELHGILTMYRRIDNSIAILSDEEKTSLDLDKIAFEGFDANHDKHFSLMSFWVDEMNLYSEYKGKYINSHTGSSLIKYRALYGITEQWLAEGIDRYPLDKLAILVESV